MTNERQDFIFRSYFLPRKTNLILVLFFSFNWDTTNCKEALLQQRDSDSENTWENEISLSRAINLQFLSQEMSTDAVFQCVSILIRKWANNFLWTVPCISVYLKQKYSQRPNLYLYAMENDNTGDNKFRPKWYFTWNRQREHNSSSVFLIGQASCSWT